MALDDDGYPTDDVLLALEHWDWRGHSMTQKQEEFYEYARAHWYYPEAFKRHDTDKFIVYSFSTLGWSGCEDLVAAMEKNLIWRLTAWSWRTGGHYQCRIRKIMDS